MLDICLKKFDCVVADLCFRFVVLLSDAFPTFSCCLILSVGVNDFGWIEFHWSLSVSVWGLGGAISMDMPV